MTIWSPAMTARLGELWANPKFSITTIALRLGREFNTVVSRNAVASKAHRVGFAATHPRKLPDTLQPGYTPKETPSERVARVIKPKVYQPKPKPVQIPVVIDPAMPLPVAMSEHDRCRWLLGDVLRGNSRPPIATDQVYARWADVPRCSNARDGEGSYCKLHHLKSIQGHTSDHSAAPAVDTPHAPKGLEELEPAGE